MRIAALIVAAGRGQRAGEGRPKQYRNLCGRPVLAWTLDALTQPPVTTTHCVIHPDDADLFAAAAEGRDLPPPIHGGATRQESVQRGLEALLPYAPDMVLIHDAARPLVPLGVIEAVVAALATGDGAMAALPVTDTLKREHDGQALAGPDRAGLWRAQTPQGFRFGPIVAAHRALAGLELTDDAAVLTAAGRSVKLVTGHEENLKITYPDDFRHAERILMGRLGDVRTGFGYDVHAFAPPGERALWLCGMEVPHERGLAGHSDADVALHAAVDAILGAMSAGDIGRHFPPSDPQWRGAPSHLFLSHAAALLRQRAGVLAQLDLTIVCETPRIAPHADAMRQRLADLLGVETGRISVKGKTTEGLGFTGRREGIACHAIATLRLPFAG